jgi:hypothetical protein
VRGAVGQHLVARTGVDLDRDLVAHGAGGQVQRGLLAEEVGHHLLEEGHGRVLALLLVAHLGLAHEAAHVGRGPGHGVAVEIDHVGSSVRVRPSDTGILYPVVRAGSADV